MLKGNISVKLNPICLKATLGPNRTRCWKASYKGKTMCRKATLWHMKTTPCAERQHNGISKQLHVLKGIMIVYVPWAETQHNGKMKPFRNIGHLDWHFVSFEEGESGLKQPIAKPNLNTELKTKVCHFGSFPHLLMCKQSSRHFKHCAVFLLHALSSTPTISLAFILYR